MVGLPYDCLSNPLGAVRFTFEKAIVSGSDPSSFDGKDWGSTDLFRHFLSDQSNLSQVPILSSETMKWIKPNTLVRFRGMIQDMLGNEFYVGAYKDGSVWRTNKFMDVCQFPMGNSPDMRIWERQLLHCVPIPGLNLWADCTSKIEICTSMDQTFEQRDKRGRMDFETVDTDDSHVSCDMLEDSPSAKRMRDGRLSSPSQSLEFKTEAACSSTITVPFSDIDPFSCLVKIYDSPQSELKLNEIIEFVGVLTFDSEDTVEKNEHDVFSNENCDEMLVNLPPKKVPRLHCIILQKLAVHDFLHSSPIIEPKPHLVKEMRESLLRNLTAILGNDTLASEFVLLHLLSKVHARADNVAVGKLSLNLICLNQESVSIFGTQLGIAIKDLLPFTTSIPLTVEYLNTNSLAPKKDYETNRLVTGALQLAEGSHLIVDETQLESGTLNSIGVENTRLLKDLITYQKGKSNIMPADIIMPFHPSSPSTSELAVTESLQAWRWYLATARSLPHSIDSQMKKVVENDLVAARQADRSLGSEEFSRWLTIGRLISASFGETSLTKEHWELAKELEKQRRERFK
ncbi:Mini-chromosome maintenance complex-binding protein [Euphorbia peplus]|nr:Mini-chromosome maintenance complex-binding protein [Euphorbia peplus]